MERGDTFLMGNPGGRTKHLWIVISTPMAHGGAFVVVNLTTTNAERAECAIRAGEHPWVIRLSAVNFGDAKLIRPEAMPRIDEGIRAKHILMQPPMDAGIINRITAAAMSSIAFPRYLRAYL